MTTGESLIGTRLGGALSCVVLVVVAAAAACGDGEPDADFAGECCLADPAGHQVSLRACENDSSCVSGTICVDAPDGG